MTNQNNKGNSGRDIPVGWAIAIVVISIIGLVGFAKDISPAFASKKRCVKAGCDLEAAEGSAYCYIHKPYKSTYSGGGTKSTSSSKQKNTSGAKNKTTSVSGSNKKSSTTTKSSSSSKSTKKIDPDDLEAY